MINYLKRLWNFNTYCEVGIINIGISSLIDVYESEGVYENDIHYNKQVLDYDSATRMLALNPRTMILRKYRKWK